MPNLDASSPAAVYGDTAATTSLVTAAFTPPTGSIIVAKVVGSDGALTSSTPTGSGLTFTSRVNVGSGGLSCRMALYTAVGAGASTTVTAAFAGSANRRGLVVEVWTSAQLAGSPAVASTITQSGAPTHTLTTVGAGSVVSWLNGDYAAVDGTASKVYRSSAVQTAFHWVTGQHTIYTAYQAAAVAGSQTYGLSAPTGQSYSLASIEIQDLPAVLPNLVMAPTR